MIQLFLIVAGAAILGFIFLKRYQLVEKGYSPLQIFRHRSRRFHLPGFWQEKAEKSDFEVTVDEMIPDATKVNPKHALKATSFKKKADAFLKKEDLKNAEKSLIQALSLDPSLQDAYNKLGLIYLRQEQFGKAEMMFRKLAVSGFNDPAYLSNLGLALYQQKKLAEARTFYERALGLDQNRAGRFFSLAQVLYELQEFESALGNFQKAAAMEPKNVDYQLSLAQFYLDRQMFAELKDLLPQILEAFPKNEAAMAMSKQVQLEIRDL